jgi:hypothetical protein
MGIIENIDGLIEEIYIPTEPPNPYFKRRNKYLPSNKKIEDFNKIMAKVDHTIKNRNVGYTDSLDELAVALKSVADIYKFKSEHNKFKSTINIKYSPKDARIVDSSIRDIIDTLQTERQEINKQQKIENLISILSNLNIIYSREPSY